MSGALARRRRSLLADDRGIAAIEFAVIASSATTTGVAPFITKVPLPA